MFVTSCSKAEERRIAALLNIATDGGSDFPVSTMNEVFQWHQRHNTRQSGPIATHLAVQARHQKRRPLNNKIATQSVYIYLEHRFHETGEDNVILIGAPHHTVQVGAMLDRFPGSKLVHCHAPINPEDYPYSDAVTNAANLFEEVATVVHIEHSVAPTRTVQTVLVAAGVPFLEQTAWMARLTAGTKPARSDTSPSINQQDRPHYNPQSFMVTEEYPPTTGSRVSI